MKEIILPSGVHVKVWQKIKLGTFKSFSDLQMEAEKRFIFCYHSKELLKESEFAVADNEELISLTKITIADLQIGENRRYLDICSKAENLGLGICSIEVPLQLCIQGPNYPNHAYVNIAINPIRHGGGSNLLNIFRLGGYHNRPALDTRNVIELPDGNPFPLQDSEEIVFSIMS
ncbi:MAG: hypothetical protein HY931_00745 [Candidatus Falkowbacteria bacterium]|nr:MAG: hypothetical protein HY931_00745 [Candidatus Falkowbacteria bacterium]